MDKLVWLYGGAEFIDTPEITGKFIGPRKEMITPWSTNAVEITQTMGLSCIERIEEFVPADLNTPFDRMLQSTYEGLGQDLFTIHRVPDPIRTIDDLAEYNRKEGLALSDEEIAYLQGVATALGRQLTDSEVFGFSQLNSEHCRHKIFNGTFIINGRKRRYSLFQLIKSTSEANPGYIVSAYKDNVAFITGPSICQFAPARQDVPDYFGITDIEAVLSLKAETHNFPTTVEPFNGAATGSGGEIRDRLAGGKGSLPLAGTAVYITSYPRLDGNRPWEKNIRARKWLYHSPQEILTKASDGASDFGNKFGQPLIAGSLLTFEHEENGRVLAFDKVIMLAGGVGFARKSDSQKDELHPGDRIVMLGGDNYRIGMGGGAVSSVGTGQYANAIELNAVQRSNPEMQKRVMNAIRAMAEADHNPIISIHDHGAGGHLNCYGELLERTGGVVRLDHLPIGDPTLSDKEIISNESQERMGLALKNEDLDLLKRVSERERAPFYEVGEATGDEKIVFRRKEGEIPFSLKVDQLFGSSPQTVLEDTTTGDVFRPVNYEPEKLEEYLRLVLQLEGVACKDWLTNKVDRCVTGKVAMQQSCGPIQLPLNNVGVMMLDYEGHTGVATAIGHAPAASILDPVAGSRLAIAEALTNLVWAPLTHGLGGVSLSANWMWPARNRGEDARLYAAVEAAASFCIQLGINIPTGKDSLSMTQRYPDGKVVIAPGTVIISAVGEVNDVRKTVTPFLKSRPGSLLLHIDFSKDTRKLGGSSLGQILNTLGLEPPTVENSAYFRNAFNSVQQLIKENLVLAGHDISSGGLVTTMLEMCFPSTDVGLEISLDASEDPILLLFSENPGVVIQVDQKEKVLNTLRASGIDFRVIGKVVPERKFRLEFNDYPTALLDIDTLRDIWYNTSYLMDQKQRPKQHAASRFENYKIQPLSFKFPAGFDGKARATGVEIHRREATGVKAAIIREKGVNGDREMAWALYMAGFDVKDVHMTDLFTGREDLSDVNMIVFVGGFSNSDVLGSAKGWAGGFRYNERARLALEKFYSRPDTLSLGVCNGCQLMMELGLLYPEMGEAHPRMHLNGSGRFECGFLNVTIPQNNSVMLGNMAGSRLGIWVAHGEGRFMLPDPQDRYAVGARYSYSVYPGNPNDSEHAVAALHSRDGRHLAIMPHFERAIYPWNWAYYPPERPDDEVSPWIIALVNARTWVVSYRKGN